VRNETNLTAALTTSISQEMAAAIRYLERGSPEDLTAFRQAGWAAHEAQRALNASAGLTSTEIALVAAIDERLSGIEAVLAAAHRMRDLGRLAAAQARAGSVRPAELALDSDIERLSEMRSRQLDRVTANMREVAAQRQNFLLAVILGAILFGVAIVYSTVRSISGPLSLLVAHARALSRGELSVRTEDELPGEFQELAEAMNHSAENLARVASVASSTSEEVATSAHQLTSAAEQVSLAATQTATAMSDVTQGAEVQVSALRDADNALQGVRERAHEVRQALIKILAQKPPVCVTLRGRAVI
jgi:methyl-accepting chemotaxis protein